MAKKPIAERKAQLLKQLEDIKKAEKKAENDRLVIIGRVIDAECKSNNELKGTVDTLLKSHLKRNAERALFDLPVLPPKQPKMGV